MTSAKARDIESEISGQTVARIDAQDESFAYSLRDYFTAAGCRVIINEPWELPIDYHVICGDSEYVKEIFSSIAQEATRRLVIVIDGNDSFGDIGRETKIILADPHTLSEEQVDRVLHFFFTSREHILDIRKNPKKHVAPLQRAPDKTRSHVEQPAPELSASLSDDTERIREIISSVFSPPKHDKSRAQKKKNRHMFAFFLTLLVLSPFLWYLTSVGLTTASIGYALFMLRSGNVEEVQAASGISRFWVESARSSLHLINAPLVLLDEGQLLVGQERSISFLSQLTSALSGVSNVFVTGKSVASQLLSRISGGGTSSPAKQVEKLRTELFSVQNNLGLAQSELHTLIADSSFPFWFSWIKKLGTRGERALAHYRQTVSYVDKFLLLYPQLSGFTGKQTYLVLLQNNLELRPTGGFIGSVARMSSEDGTITDIDVADVYTLDGQLKGHVDPPQPIRELLGQEHWYLRDSNWEADFSASAARAAWFYEKETGIHVDGVIGITTPLVVDLLGVTGPLTLADYNDRITGQNFYGKSLYYTQSDFFPGSTQKKDFLGSLTRTLLEHLTIGKGANPVGVFRVITGALTHHDLMFYFPNPELGSIVSQFGWSGRVFSDPGCAGEAKATCLFDPVMSVEANLGVNKVNYFVKRALRRTIAISEQGAVSESMSLSLENTSRGKPDDSGGPYRAYIRFLLPPDAIPSEMSVNGVVVPIRDIKQKIPLPLPYAQYADKTAQYQSIGVALELPPGREEALSVSYTRIHTLNVGPGGATYEIFTQKQAGVSATPLEVTVSYPPFWEASNTEFLAKEGTLEYNTTLSSDSRIKILFKK